MSVPVVDSSCGCNRCTSRTAEMYDLPGRCINCGARFTVRSRKGDKAPLSVTCPACEVNGYSWRAKPMSTDEQRRPSTEDAWLSCDEQTCRCHWPNICPDCGCTHNEEAGAEREAEAYRADRLEAALREHLYPKGFDRPDHWSLTNEGAKEIARAALGEAEASEETGR